MIYKSIFFSFFIFIFCIIACAQPVEISVPNPGKKLISEVEIFGGLGLTTAYGNDLLKSQRVLKNGYSFGTRIVHNFSSRVRINFGVSFDKRGYNEEFNPLTDDPTRVLVVKNERDFSYIDIHTSGSFEFGKNKRGHSALGIYYGRLKSTVAKSSLWENGTLINQSSSTSLSDLSDHDFGLVISAGFVLFNLNSYKLSLDLVDKIGLADITNPDLPFFPVKNHTLSLVLTLTKKI